MDTDVLRNSGPLENSNHREGQYHHAVRVSYFHKHIVCWTCRLEIHVEESNRS